MSNELRNFIVLIFMIITYAFVSDARAGVNCNKHPIFCQIKKNNSRINKKYAMKLSNLIYKASRKYHISPRIFTAILAQESQYSLSAKGCHYGFRQETPLELKSRCESTGFVKGSPYMSDYGYASCLADGKLNPEMIKSKVCSDFGIGQIYYKTAASYGFDINRLTTDLSYSVFSAAKVLSDFKRRYEAKEVNWWTRYNASSKTKREIYRQLVTRFM